MFKKRIFTILLLLVLLTLVSVPHSRVSAQTATPDVNCDDLWTQYDKAVLDKNDDLVEKLRGEIVNCITNSNAASSDVTKPTSPPTRDVVQGIPFLTWTIMQTVDKNDVLSPVQIAMSTNNHDIAFAIYLDGKWKTYQGIFTSKHDGAKPLIAYKLEDKVHVAVYFEKSLSVLNVYHLPVNGDAPTNFEAASLSFSLAKTTTVDDNGCFIGAQQSGMAKLCPVTQPDGAIDYVFVK